MLDDKNLNVYVIVSTQRSGSSFLCRLLELTGRLGAPGEHFLPYFRLYEQGERIHVTNKFDAIHALEDILKNGSKRQNVCGIKLMWNYFYFVSGLLNATLGVSSDKSLFEVFNNIKIINLRRRNILRQAISQIKAKQTGIYHLTGGENFENIKKQMSRVRYDEKEILDTITNIRKEEDCWHSYIGSLCNFRLFYEDLLDDVSGTVSEIYKYIFWNDPDLYVDHNVDFRKVSDEFTEEWVEDFLQSDSYKKCVDLGLQHRVYYETN